MRKRTLLLGAGALLAALAGCDIVQHWWPQPPQGTGGGPLGQGKDWTAAAQAQFYSTDQGSRMIPLIWIQSLKLPDGTPFLQDGLARYGYLANPQSPVPGLPVGFVSAIQPSSPDGPALGMTCAACHTRDLTVGGVATRIDGGPALADFGRMLLDLDGAIGAVQLGQPGFEAFANAVLGANNTPAAQAALADRLKHWYAPYHAIIGTFGGQDLWGVGRLDAISMIFDRVTGLDIGDPANDYIIAGNLKKPDAPTRYPFLWNAPVQDRTQWPSFATNGSDLLGLARNLGEVMGVFGIYHPRPTSGPIFGINYLANGMSANWNGLGTLEGLVRDIGAPAWPAAWGTPDPAQVARGHDLYDGKAGGGVNCASCHFDVAAVPAGVKRLGPPGLQAETWCTPVQVVGTDQAEWGLLSSTVDTGVLNGVNAIGVGKIGPTDTAINVLIASVTGSIVNHVVPLTTALAKTDGSSAAPVDPTAQLSTAFSRETPSGSHDGNAPHCGVDYTEPPKNGYESRVLRGIWATAPYLHNGSVPTLRDLLEPTATRPARFAIGTEYDPVKAGLAPVQTGVFSVLTTTDCSAIASGNSRCGHEGAAFGTTLSPADKDALVAYLKTL